MVHSGRRSDIGRASNDRPSETTPSIDIQEDNVVVIAGQGDAVLHVQHETTAATQVHRFRVQTGALKATSKYFGSLLQGRFNESEHIEARHRVLRESYGDPGRAPADELPVLKIEHVGRISTVKSIVPLCTDFLRILHGDDIQAIPPVANLANLAIVADRFDAVSTIKSYVQRKKIFRAIDGKTTPKSDSVLTEERVRQRLLVGIMLGYSPWVEKYSARLILRGWLCDEVDDDAALWWDMPARVEGELIFRRDCILETIESLQSYFVALYLSRERQCKLGYDSSAQCDSFQLGEMIRFFVRVGTLQLNGMIDGSATSPAVFSGDIHTLIDNLRQVPEYQIDRNHMHCGIRTRLMPLLDLVVECLPHIGICGECWSDKRMDYAWMDAKRPLVWKRQSFYLRGLGHQEMHVNVRTLFTATQRDWSTLGNLTFNNHDKPLN